MDDRTELYELTFRHQAGPQYVERCYCVGLEKSQAVMNSMMANFWKLTRVHSMEAELTNWLHDCYTMEVR